MADEKEISEKDIVEVQKRNSGTSEDFIVRWPLYVPFNYFIFQAPPRISADCPQCNRETTWSLMKAPGSIPTEGRPEEQTKWLHYACNLCGKAYSTILYKEIDYTEVRPAGRVGSGLSNRTFVKPDLTKLLSTVLKVGQYPPLSVSIPKPLEKNLGKDAAALYRKALICRNQGFGLGAVTYIRRVVEDKTDELLELVAQNAEALNVDAPTVSKIRAAKTAKDSYENKLKLASTVLPDSLIPDGANPLGQLFGFVSEGIHELSEEDCIAVADGTKKVFEYMFTNLRAETESRKDFMDTVKKWAGGKGFEK